MKIAIDARMMGSMSTRGSGRYIEELVRGLLKVAPEHRYILLEQDPEHSPFEGAPQVEHVKADISWYGFEEQVRLTGLIKKTKADIVHFPHWNMPLTFRGKCIVTIHDLLLLHQPSSAKASTRNSVVAAAKRVGHRLVLRHAINQTSVICVPTKWVGEDIKHFYPWAANKIVVTSEGLGDFPAPDHQRVPKDPFLMYLGSAYPHKRLDLLLEAWQEVAARHPGLFLVIAGEKDVFMDRWIKFVEAKNIPRVQFLGKLTDAELAGFLDHAKAFVFPSSHEGFGLPPLEALSRACPVVSSDSTCLPESLSMEGVFFFRDGDKNDMIRAVEMVLDPHMNAKEMAIHQVPFIRERYRWETVAKATLEAYERA